MAYGLLIHNKWGKIVISDETVAIQKVREGVLEMSSVIAGGPSIDETYRFNFVPTRNALLFMQPGVGQYVTPPHGIGQLNGVATSAILSNWADDIPFFECAPAYDITRPKATWGLEIRAPNGDLRFHSGAELVAIDGHYFFDKSSVDTGYYSRGWDGEQSVGSNEWICPQHGGGLYRELISNYPASRRNIQFAWGIARIAGPKIAVGRILSTSITTSDSNAISHVVSNVSCFTAS